MNYLIICGSHRPQSNSLKVSNYLKQTLLAKDVANEVSILDLNTIELPFWEEGNWKKDERLSAIIHPIHHAVQQADALLIVTPDYGGMVPARLKNLFLFLSAKVSGNKPAMIVGVSSGLGGSYPVVELRSSSYKNTRICYLPEHLIILKADEVLNEEPNPNSEFDVFIRQRIDWSLDYLREYAIAFQHFKHSTFNFAKFPFGL